MKKVLIITAISGFLPQFEKNNVKLLHEAGCEIHYASNFKNPIYTFNEEDLKAQGIRLHQIDIAKSPFKFRTNFRAVRQLLRIIRENDIISTYISSRNLQPLFHKAFRLYLSKISYYSQPF